MDRSNIVSVTRLLPHLSGKSMQCMKSCIFEQFDCENESQFLCKILYSFYKALSIESTTIMRKKAMQIADLQDINIQQTIQRKTIATKSEHHNNIRGTHNVYKYIHQQYSDLLSNVHSDTIDHLATFLSKEESIEFGYLYT